MKNFLEIPYDTLEEMNLASKDKAEKLISSIDSIMLVVQAVLDKTTRENLSQSFDNIKHALETFDRTAMRLDTMIASERYKISDTSNAAAALLAVVFS